VSAQPFMQRLGLRDKLSMGKGNLPDNVWYDTFNTMKNLKICSGIALATHIENLWIV